MAALLSTLSVALWTLIVVRIVAARATLGDRTLVAYLALGALLGSLGGPAAQKVFAPYGETGPWVVLLVAMARQAVLLVPVFAMRAFAAISIADAFLLAFITGFGYDLVATFLAVTAATAPFPALQWVPPFVVQTDAATVAGYGYWTALVALAYAGTRRFVRRPRAAIVTTALVFVAVCVETASLNRGDVTLYRWFATLTLSGWVTPGLTLLSAIALSLYEVQWVRPSAADQAELRQPTGPRTLLAYWSAMLSALARRAFAEYRSVRTEFGLRTQRAIASTEASLSPDDAALRQLDRHLRVQQWAEESGTALSPLNQQAFSLAVNTRRRLATGWGTVVLVYLILPLLPSSVGAFFWSLWILHEPLPHLGLGLLNTGLVAILLWRYIMAPEQPVTRGADDVISFRAEQLLLQTALGVVILVVIHGRPELLYPFGSPMLLVMRAQLPSLQPVQVATFYCLLAVAATGIALAPMARWALAPMEYRRASALRRTIQLVMVVVIAWATNLIYTSGVPALHRAIGESLFNIWGANGNYAAAIMISVVAAASTVVLYSLARPVARRVEAFLGG